MISQAGCDIITFRKFCYLLLVSCNVACVLIGFAKATVNEMDASPGTKRESYYEHAICHKIVVKGPV